MKTFLKRTFSSVILLAIFGFIIFGNPDYAIWVFRAFTIFLSITASLELSKLVKASGYEVDKIAVTIFVTISSLLVMFRYPAIMSVGTLTLIFLVVCYAWILLLFSKNKPEKLGSIFHTIGAYLILALPLVALISLYCYSPLSLIEEANSVITAEYTGQTVLLYLILVTKIGDIGAYLVGSLSNWLLPGGNHKMIPSISPGKSWEGAAGGLLAAIGLSLYLAPVCKITANPYGAILIGVLLFLGCSIGDLAESSLKRMGSMKDSGSFFPGIGGVLDLIDSLMINSIIFVLFLVYMEPVMYIIKHWLAK